MQICDKYYYNIQILNYLKRNNSNHNMQILVRLAIAYINANYNGKFDWFLRADDDTYVIMENLRLFFKTRDRKAPEMYGIHYKLYGEYIGTGGSITVSALNFDKMVNHMNHTLCSKGKTHDDDVEISNCLKLVC